MLNQTFFLKKSLLREKYKAMFTRAHLKHKISTENNKLLFKMGLKTALLHVNVHSVSPTMA
jgi:hypothetical protein